MPNTPPSTPPSTPLGIPPDTPAGSALDVTPEQAPVERDLLTTRAAAPTGGLLTAGEEVALARRIEVGVFAQAVLDGHATLPLGSSPAGLHLAGSGAAAGIPTPAELRALAVAGARAREEFTAANLRLVTAVARRYQRSGIPLDDLVQEGAIGLTRAVDRFDWSRGFRFSTYAMWWIRQAITASLTTARTMRRSQQVEAALRKMYAIEADLATRLGRTPTREEVAAQIQMSPARLSALLQMDAPEASLDAGFTGTDDALTWAQALPDLAAAATLTAVEDTQDRARLRQALTLALGHLPALDQQVLRLRFGLDGAAALSLDEAAERIGMTRAKTRAVENAALRRLRMHSGSRVCLEEHR